VPTAECDIALLPAYLKAKLPDYMLPVAWIPLPGLPRNANGKVERRALPAPGDDRRELALPYVAPRTPIEELLAGMFEELLGVERVGIHDSFFELGGHSLQGIRLMSRVGQAFSVELQIQALFDSPTVEGLALAVAERLVETADPSLVAEVLAELGQEAVASPLASCAGGVSAASPALPGISATGR